MTEPGRIGKLVSLLTRIRRAILVGLGTLLTALLATGLRGTISIF